jgi:hypothetical protein
MLIQALSSSLFYPNRGPDPLFPQSSLESSVNPFYQSTPHPFSQSSLKLFYQSSPSLESLNRFYQTSLEPLNPSYLSSIMPSLKLFYQSSPSLESLNPYYQSSIMPILAPRASFPPSNGGIYRVLTLPWIRSRWRPAAAARNGGLRWI